MLYEGAIKFAKKSIIHIQNKEIPEKGIAIGRLQDIINELNNSLNHEVGGEISRNLEGLYNFMIEQTTEANINNDTAPLENCLQLLNTLYDGWVEAVGQLKKESPSQKHAVK